MFLGAGGLKPSTQALGRAGARATPVVARESSWPAPRF